ncbi:protein containing DUF1566 [Candidatus Magnetobacterium bavaricum]|uniref:Protein containing DUF1566 n=1 Tax=Candidatus Magnetobacterium bavaricum TaxID=29290 RepID=A0A0F3GQ33_9BACT|nr:protein containing DUF1566 [Candidatus Magnetobacterium bavaricum]
MNYKVYISHTANDKAIADNIATMLRNKNVNCATTSGNTPVVSSCSVVVIIMSAHTPTSTVVKDEEALAASKQRYEIAYWSGAPVSHNFHIDEDISWTEGIDFLVKRIMWRLFLITLQKWLPYIGAVLAALAVVIGIIPIMPAIKSPPPSLIPSPTPIPTPSPKPTPTSIPKSTRFADNGDQTITDTSTGLMWTKDARLTDYKTWQEALDYVASMNKDKGTFGYTDWRLPDRKELESLVKGSKGPPA